eukprot:sb/3474196/
MKEIPESQLQGGIYRDARDIDRETLIERQIETERQRDRETERLRSDQRHKGQKHKDRETEGQIDRETEGQRYRETERQRDRETEGQRDKEIIIIIIKRFIYTLIPYTTKIQIKIYTLPAELQSGSPLVYKTNSNRCQCPK